MARHVYFGNFFHNLSFEKSEVILNGFIAVEDGKVKICETVKMKE